MVLQQKDSDVFKLRVPVDTTTVNDVQAGGNVKVIAQDKNGNISSKVVQLDPFGKSEALLSLPMVSGTVRIMAGSENLSDEEMFKRTIYVVLLLSGLEYMGQETRMNRQIIKLRVNNNNTTSTLKNCANI